MILFTNQFNVLHPVSGYIVENLPGVEAGAAFTQNAVSTHFPAFGNKFVAVALMFFAFTTVMAYYYIAESNFDFLLKGKKSKYGIWILRILILFSVYLGCVNSAKLAWTLGDIGVGLMAWMNLIAILLLCKKAVALADDYEKQKKQGLDPQFDNRILNLQNLEYWNNLEAENKQKS